MIFSPKLLLLKWLRILFAFCVSSVIPMYISKATCSHSKPVSMTGQMTVAYMTQATVDVAHPTLKSRPQIWLEMWL